MGGKEGNKRMTCWNLVITLTIPPLYMYLILLMVFLFLSFLLFYRYEYLAQKHHHLHVWIVLEAQQMIHKRSARIAKDKKKILRKRRDCVRLVKMHEERHNRKEKNKITKKKGKIKKKMPLTSQGGLGLTDRHQWQHPRRHH